MAGSTDMGDVTNVMPGIHPEIGGITGRAHARDYEIVDKEMAYVMPAKAMAMTVIDLLYDGAAVGKKVKAENKPPMTIAEYMAMWANLFSKKD